MHMSLYPSIDAFISLDEDFVPSILVSSLNLVVSSSHFSRIIRYVIYSDSSLVEPQVIQSNNKGKSEYVHPM